MPHRYRNEVLKFFVSAVKRPISIQQFLEVTGIAICKLLDLDILIIYVNPIQEVFSDEIFFKFIKKSLTHNADLRKYMVTRFQ